MGNKDADFRSIPTVRVKAFIERYIEANYPYENGGPDTLGNSRYGNFCHEADIALRVLWGIRNEERPNVNFDIVDRMLTRLGCLELWYVSPEDGGFADYYLPDIPPAPAEPNVEQSRKKTLHSAKRYARDRGLHWLDVLHERALEEASSLEEAAA